MWRQVISRCQVRLINPMEGLFLQPLHFLRGGARFETIFRDIGKRLLSLVTTVAVSLRGVVVHKLQMPYHYRRSVLVKPQSGGDDCGRWQVRAGVNPAFRPIEALERYAPNLLVGAIRLGNRPKQIQLYQHQPSPRKGADLECAPL